MKRLILSVLLLGFCCAVLPIRGQVPGEAAYRAAEVLRQQGKFREAITRYDEAIAADDKNYRFYLQKGRAQYQLGDLAGARASLELAIRYGEAYTPAATFYLLGKINRALDDEAKALDLFQQAADREVNQQRKAQYQLLVIQPLISQARYEEAERYLDAVEEIDRDNVKLHFYRARLAAARQDWGQAQRHYEQALRSTELREATPEERAQYYFGLALSLLEQGQAEQAEQAFERANFGQYRELVARYLADSNPAYYYRLAASYYVNQEYAVSETYIKKLLEAHPEYANAYTLRARIAVQTHRPEDAVRHYQEAISHEKDPTEQARLYMQAAQVQLDYDNPAGALQSVNAAVAADERSLRSPRLLYVKARAEYLSGRHREAVQSFDRLLATKLDPRSQASYRFMQGMAARKAGLSEKAIKAFQGARYGPFKPAAEMELEELGVTISKETKEDP